MERSSIEQKIFLIIFILIIIYVFLPFILFKTDSIIEIHDNLDQMIPYYKMYKENNLFFKFDVPTKGFSNMSTLYYGHVNFSFTPLLYYFFNDFNAYSINYITSVLLGFISMFLLLGKLLKPNIYILIFVSISFAILPVGPNMSIAVSTLPLIIFLFIYFLQKEKFTYFTYFLLLYPIFSTFTMTGIFILGFWLLGFIILWIKNKKPNLNLLIGFILLMIGYILVDIRLFYVMFVLKTPLNRSVFSLNITSDFFIQIKTFIKSFINYSKNGHYHAASLQRKIIIPITFLITLYYFIDIIINIKKKDGKIFNKINSVLSELNIKVKKLFIFEIIIVIFYLIAALHDSGLISDLIKQFFPILDGFNWGRVWIFNRVLWYIIFAICLQIILQSNIYSFEIKVNNKYSINIQKVLLLKIKKILILFLVFLQLLYIIKKPTEYKDIYRTWINETLVKTGIAKIISPNRDFNEYISYKEFFSKDLFDKIKFDITYNNEIAVAFGFHPSVLMYNSFNCIDGYNNSYPLEYMKKFRTLIAPEFEINMKDSDYYDEWGGRMYLYSSELSYGPTKEKYHVPVNLNIDINVFINDFNGTYILSRAEILNINELKLKLVNEYFDKNSIYTIYLYKVDN